jgi:hypothetical protein
MKQNSESRLKAAMAYGTSNEKEDQHLHIIGGGKDRKREREEGSQGGSVVSESVKRQVMYSYEIGIGSFFI